MPEVSFRKGLNDIASFTDLRTDILRITLGVIWRPEGEEEIIRESFPLAKDTLPMLRESVPSEKEEPESDTIIAIMEEPEEKIIKEISIDSINIRETFVTQTYPLLPYIFFDSASVHQIMKQKDQSNALDSPTRELLRGGDGFFEQFDESTLPKKTLEIYYRLLDILGNRLRKTKAKLFITGFTDGTELPDEKDRLLLATKRAESVAEYLKSNWGIEESRLIVRAFNLPELPTNPDYTEGFEENRRVEITSDDSKILQPVIHSKFNEYKFEDDKININVVYKKQSECESVNFGLYSGNKDLFIKEFNTCETKVEIPLTDKLKNQLIENAFEKSLSTMLSFKRSDGSYENYTLDIGIQREIEKYEIGRLNLIVFDFDRADISVSNQNTLKLFINNNVEKNSIVRITGSTDKLGTAEYNLWLSEQRANNVYKFIKGMMPEINIVEVKGLGSNLLPYDNDLPEGRFYCRTVLIEVTTPK
jgi:outer membrane protein OmpA-like peptidoglycan-associated protein